MRRFTHERGFKINRIWSGLCGIFLAIFLIFFFRGINVIDNSTGDEQAKALENAIRKSVVHCYCVEGTYPPNIEYLKEHYKITYDESKYYVDYISIGSNLMPDITIITKKSN